MGMDYFIIVVTTVAGLAFHWWLYVLIQRWMQRDLALSIAGDNPECRAYLLQCLQQAKAEKIRKKDLETWLRSKAEAHPQPE